MNEAAAAAPAPPAGRWARASYAYALLVAGILAYFLMGLPVQLSDCFTLLADVHDLSLVEILRRFTTQRGYFRPFLWGQTRVVYALADGNYYAWYRTLHAVQAAVLLVLFVRLVRPRALVDACAIPFGLAVLIGMHTFQGTVREAFPINTFMTILLCCVAAANLVFARPRWWVDLAVTALFVFAALTVESGLLVWVIVAAAWLAGARGVSTRGVAATTALLAGYFILRFAILDVGAPALVERSSGYGFRYLESSELQAQFGANPSWFYAYNVLTSFLSVLAAEPRGGVWTLTRSIAEGDARLPLLVNVTASIAATALILRFVWRRRGSWLAWRFERDDQLVILFLAVLSANAVISYPYTKDVIMSPAGVFFALAAFVAGRDLLLRLPSRFSPRTAAAAAFCIVLSVSWGIRATGTLVALRHQVFNVRTDWAAFDEWAADNDARLDDPDVLALKNQLQREAIARYPPSGVVGSWVQLFDLD